MTNGLGRPLTAKEQELRAVGLELTGTPIGHIRAAEMVTCGFTATSYRQARDFAEYALANNTAITQYTIDVIPHVAVMTHRLMHPVSLGAAGLVALSPDRAAGWARIGMGWLAVLSGIQNAEEMRTIRDSLRGSTLDSNHICATWSHLLDEMGALAYAAGLPLDEAIETATTTGLDRNRLQMLATLRGYPVIPV